MRTISLETVKDGEKIVTNGNYVVISGKHPWIFRKDGSFVARIKLIVRAYNLIFLPRNTVLMSSLLQRKLYYVSLETGSILWTIPHKKRGMLSPDELFCSSDGETVYYAYQSNHVLCIDRIVPAEQKYESFQIPSDSGVISHCYCDSEDQINMLCSVAVSERFCQDRIFSWSPLEPSLQLKYQTQREIAHLLSPLACNNTYVLYGNLTVLSMKTGDWIHLLENEHGNWSAAGPISITAFDDTRNLLTIRDFSGRANFIIDCYARKIVAYYSTITPGFSFGCLIGDDFWLGSKDGVIKLPFPHMDKV